MKRILTVLALAACCVQVLAGNVCGRVTCNRQPMAGVAVSDGISIVFTDRDGRYSIDSDKRDGSVFVITPSGYVARSIDGLRPGFWQPLYLAPELEEVHDFVLEKQDQSRYTVVFLADMHLSNDPARDDLNRFRNEVMPVIRRQAAAATGAVYTINLGDTTHDIYWGEFNFNETDALRLLQDLEYPTPMYSIMGNHDHDPSVVGDDVDRRAAWRERDCWGPGQFSVNIGGDHWVFLDNIIYINVEGKGKKAPGVLGDRSYLNELTEDQMAWLEKDLALVDKDARVFICTHAPMLFSGRSSGLLMPRKQVQRIAELCSPATVIATISVHTKTSPASTSVRCPPLPA